MPEVIVEFIKTYGVFAGLVLYFVWQSWIRENRFAKVQEETERYVREEMKGTIERNSNAMTSLEQAIDKTFPCPMMSKAGRPHSEE